MCVCMYMCVRNYGNPLPGALSVVLATIVSGSVSGRQAAVLAADVNHGWPTVVWPFEESPSPALLLALRVKFNNLRI